MSCPFDCEYLQEARKREPSAKFDPVKQGHPEIRVTEEFLDAHSMLMWAMSSALIGASEQSGAFDSDAREAIASLIQTYRTLQSGVIYENLPANPLAANLYRVVQEAVEKYRHQERQLSGMSKLRDSDVLSMLVFLERLSLDRNNGRPRGRAFLDILRKFQPETVVPEQEAPSLILP